MSARETIRPAPLRNAATGGHAHRESRHYVAPGLA